MAPSRNSVVRALAVLGLAVAVPALRAQDLSGERAQKAEAVKADLLRLSDLERTYYAQNKAFTVDIKVLGFNATSGAQVTMSYASARAWAANATHPQLEPFACFVIVSSPTGGSDAEKPFCQDMRRGTAASTLAKAGPAEVPTTKAAPPAQKPAEPTPAPSVSAPPQAATPMKTAPAPTPRKAAAAPQKTAVAPQKSAPAPQKADAAPSQVAAAPSAKAAVPPTTQRRADTKVRGKVLNAPALQAQGDVAADARAQTRNASPVRAAGAPEALTAVAFSERLAAIAAGAREVLAAKAPELARDPYESSTEYAARRAQAMAVYERREDEYFAKNSHTFTVQISGRDAKYDPDREILDLGLDAVTLPVARDLGAPQLGVSCYTRPVFWCSPDAGMTYEATGLWHVTRAKARELDVLRAPLTVQARFVVGKRDDQHGAAVTLVSLELQARGQTLAKWDVAAETR